MYDVNLNDYTVGIHLDVSCDGKGTTNLAFHKTTSSFVVIKKYFIDDKESDDYHLIQHEIVTTRQLQHPNILPYLNAFVSGHDVYVVSPLMSYGSCSSLIKKHFNEGFPELAIAFIIRDVLHGLDYIHRKGFIHRALRASHILISAQGQACICGMRYSCEVVQDGKWQRLVYDFPKSSTNNLKWLSPELLQQDLRGYNEKSDVYSLGMTICELANGAVPFADMPDTLMLVEKIRGSMPRLLDQSTFPEDVMDIDQSGDGTSQEKFSVNLENIAKRAFSEAFHSITELCLQCDPNNRPSVNYLLGHSFFKQCRKTDVSLLDILKSVKPLNEYFGDFIGNDTEALETKLENLELENYSWDFENT
ncbi:hypothetical protein QAD02_018835 [Eretmocerus hayati]|uniref:Uncharacterized protein n=1 Tax=Eretmocerus hayati TaxID=131215 RepID=A0ACC2PIZ6_9HYME|nr:hypothetical protein QAD02_018835 [Eretmocerus hayati]